MNNTCSTVTALLYLACVFYPTVIVATPPPFFVCTDYHCDNGLMVTLTDDQWRQVRMDFLPESTAQEERQRIRRAIALLENQVGQIAGTWRDLGKNFAGVGQPGQLDCISESKNTTTYLNLLEDDGLLRWHRVEKRQLRRPWILDAHWAAVIRDRTDDAGYAVDSWFLDNGHPPYIQSLDRWLSGQSFGSNLEPPNQ